MKGKVSRAIIMVAGILTVIVILVSQAYYLPSSQNIEKTAKKEQKQDKPVKQVSLAPSEVVPSSAVQLDKNTQEILSVFSSKENVEKSFSPVVRVITSFVKVFLRATISPNAP